MPSTPPPPRTESLNSQWMWNCCGPRYDLDCECRFEGSMCIIIIVEGQVAHWRGPNTPSNWFNGNNDNNKVDRSVPGCSGVGNPVNQSTSTNTLDPTIAQQGGKGSPVTKMLLFFQQTLDLKSRKQRKDYEYDLTSHINNTNSRFNWLYIFFLSYLLMQILVLGSSTNPWWAKKYILRLAKNIF